MIDLSQIPPTKKEERSHIERQFLRWHKYFVQCKDEEKKKKLLNQTIALGNLAERIILKRHFGR